MKVSNKRLEEEIASCIESHHGCGMEQARWLAAIAMIPLDCSCDHWFEADQKSASSLIGGAQSPIEKALAQALIEAPIPIHCIESQGGNMPDDFDGITRPDFSVLVYEGERVIAIYCDGHDFHERTKEQAERDRSIDRKLQEAGIVVMRFTGREIYRDAHACAYAVARMFHRMQADGKARR